MKRAVIVGKFHPFHNGHSYLIDTAIAECDSVYVLVCDSDAYTIDASLREQWIAAIHPSAHVKIIPDIGKDDDSAAWAEHTTSFLGFTPDIIYTSEDYGDTWALEMGCEHRKVDYHRRHIPVSATAIRSDVLKYWNYMHPIVRKHYTRRIVVLGAESTGTTTLASDLSEYYQAPWTIELGRYYSLSLLHANHAWTDEDFAAIAKMQQEYEDTMAGLSNGLIICDTNAFATKLWQERYVGHITPQVERLANAARADLYILTGDEIPFEQDGLRDGEHIRHTMHLRFIEELDNQHTPYIIATGSKQKRLQRAVKAINALPQKTISLQKEYQHEN